MTDPRPENPVAAPRPVRRFALSHAQLRLLGVAVRAWPNPVTWKRPKHQRTFEVLVSLRLVTGTLGEFTATPAGCQELDARALTRPNVAQPSAEIPAAQAVPEDVTPKPPKLTADGRLAAALAKQPARRAACPVCSAPVGRPCKRPSGYTIPGGGVHAPRVRAAQLVRP